MQVDFLVVGSGIAGLSFALKASSLGSVVVATKKRKADTATNLAQGGVAAVMSDQDSFASHVQDTLDAGAGLCDYDVVDFVIKNGPARIEELLKLGVSFVQGQDGRLSLGKEGGHSNRRVAHAFDLTGSEIERALLDQVSRCAGIELIENQICIDLAVEEKNGETICRGAYFLDANNSLVAIEAKTVVLCTGGCGKVYLYTSNPDIATGDGIAIATRAGAKINNMEFVQFHPTCLYHLQARNFLISEAVRGEGAVLLNQRGERFMERAPGGRAELSTRDIVARAIDTEMKQSGADCVYLDISHKSETFLEKRFPAIYGKCASLGINMASEPIPVVPAAHYLCGGVVTDFYGRTSVNNLFALGETACTGLHGANRLASNSLLEALVFAESAFQYCKDHWPLLSNDKQSPLPEYAIGGKDQITEEILITHNWDVIRRLMWNYVGIVRKYDRLKRAEIRLSEVGKDVEDLIKQHKITHNMLELRNISLVSLLIVQASLARRESVGLHHILQS